MASNSTLPPSLMLTHRWPVADQIAYLRRTAAATTSTEADDDSLLGFVQRTFPAYAPADHHRKIAEHLESVERGEIKRLMIFMPPRHGKSELASVRFPAWYLGRNPDKSVIAASYAAQLAYRFSRQARNIVRSPEWPYKTVRLADDQSAVHAWGFDGHRGGYIAAGVGGPITGMGADLLIIDDPVKNQEEADSQLMRDSIWDWYTSTAYTRLEKNAAVVLIMTRWHHDDLAGRLLAAQEQGGERWDVLSLPAIDADGKALWPEKYDVPALEATRRTIGSRAWSALYEQRPSNDDTAIIRREWWQYYDHAPESRTIIQVWDTAFKAKTSADYSVCATWCATSGGFYLLDLWRDRVEFPELKRVAMQQAAKWRPHAVLIEDKASGQSLIQEMRRGTRLPILAVNGDTDKVVRLNAVSPEIEAGRCYLPSDAPWVSAFVEEHVQFPSGAHDDQVDTTAMALRRLARGGISAGIA